MDLNATLIGQMITFALFVWFTMRFVWPPITKAMEERRKKIADGLAAAEQGRRELELAEIKSNTLLEEAKIKAASIIEQANQRAHRIVEESKDTARVEGERLIRVAQDEIEQQYQTAKQELVNKVTQIAISGAEKILQREVTQASNDEFLRELVREM